uniref:Uncharacterized protein n=1 Tax=Tanacetum cinerariifolium TaxID=118510 RepID=A0A6L2LS24_TANCI|nr:hypothetical protein [Tanacetum cinerariifolium]
MGLVDQVGGVRYPESGIAGKPCLMDVVDDLVARACHLADRYGKLLTMFENWLIPVTVTYTHAYDDRIYVGYTQEDIEDICLLWTFGLLKF